MQKKNERTNNMEQSLKRCKDEMSSVIKFSPSEFELEINSRHIKISKKEISFILNQYEKKENIKDGIRLIKSLNLEWKDYNKIWDRYSIRIFYNYKIKECLDDKFDILLDYALISETLYNELINKLLNRLKKREKKVSSKFDKENINNNMNLKEIEFEFMDNNNITNDKKIDLFSISPLKEDSNIFPDCNIINKIDNFNDNADDKDNIMTKEDSEEDITDCRIILNNIQGLTNDNLKEKITILFKLGREKKYLLTKSNKYLFDSIFNFSLPKISLSKFIPEDKFGPHNPNCFALTANVNIVVPKHIFVIINVVPAIVDFFIS